MCLPVSITLSCTSLYLRLTTLLNRKARPVAPVNLEWILSVLQWLAVLWMSHLVEMSSSLLVRTVSHEAQENRRVPPMCWMKIRPIFTFTSQQNHSNIRIGIQSQLNDYRRVLLPPLKREQVRHTIFIISLNIRYTA